MAQGNAEKVAVVIGTVTNDLRIFNVPKLTVSQISLSLWLNWARAVTARTESPDQGARDGYNYQILDQSPNKSQARGEYPRWFLYWADR